MQSGTQAQSEREFTDDEVIARAFTFADLSSYSIKQRLLIRLADLGFYTIIRLVGSTIRYEVRGWENWEAAGGRRPWKGHSRSWAIRIPDGPQSTVDGRSFPTHFPRPNDIFRTHLAEMS